MLAAALASHEGELRADLQEHYGIDLDHAVAGGHAAAHVAALVAHLPQGSRLAAAHDPDAVWTLDRLLAAALVNSLNSLIYGMGDPRKRGRRPEPVGPSWAKGRSSRALPARAVPVEQLLRELNRPRGGSR